LQAVANGVEDSTVVANAAEIEMLATEAPCLHSRGTDDLFVSNTTQEMKRKLHQIKQENWMIWLQRCLMSDAAIRQINEGISKGEGDGRSDMSSL
jgi:hypothetical protein